MMLGIGDEDYSEEERQEIEQMRASRFGLGTKRTLEHALEFSGINLRERKMEKNKCGNLEWVPYEENPASDYYGLQETLGRGLIDGGTGFSLDNLDFVGLPESRNLSTKQIANGLRIGGGIIFTIALMVMYGGKFRKKAERHTH